LSEVKNRFNRLSAVWSNARRGDVAPRTLNRSQRRAAEADARRQANEAAAILEKQHTERAGLLMDAQLREFAHEYNGRALSHGLDAMPSSFNVAGAMLAFDENHFVFRILPEQDHVFSWPDFVDFVTSRDAPSDPFAIAAALPERQVFAFNAYDDPHDLTFSSGGDDYGVGGVSLVRHGDEVSVMLVAGKIADLEAETVAAAGYVDEVSYRPGGRPHPDRKAAAGPLGDHVDLHKTVILTRISISARAVLVRYVLTDQGNSWTVQTDDPAVFDDASTTADLLPGMIEEIEKQDVLFGLCRTSLLLPAYFAFKITLVRSVKTTPPSKKWGGPFRPSKGTAFGGNVRYKTVSALRIINWEPRAASRFTAPQFRVSVAGFWRTLPAGATGKGPNNEPVEGRTWVCDHERWTECPERPIEVLVKSRVAIARRIAASEEAVKGVERSATDEAKCDATSMMVAPTAEQQRVSREQAYRERRLLTSRLRWSILQRDDFRCVQCGADAAADKSVRLEVDHIRPLATGGKTTPENLRSLCSRCNNGKGAQV
jgi:hypothetical protein